MPLQADDRLFPCPIRAIYAPAKEMLASLHVLADPEHHVQSREWARRTAGSLSPRLREELNYLGKTFNQWLNAADLITAQGEGMTRSVPEVLDAIRGMNDGRFLYLILGEEIPHDAAVAWMQGSGPRPQIGSPGLPPDTRTERERWLNDPAGLKERLVDALLGYWEEHFREELARREPLVLAAVAHESGRLGSSDPVEYLTSLNPRIVYDESTREVIFKKYRDFRYNPNDLEAILLVPSTFSAPHLMIGHLDDRLIIFVNLPASASGSRGVPPELSERLKALADDTRFAILRGIAQRPRCTQEIALAMGLAEPTVSRHLRILKEAGLASYAKEGAFVFYRAELTPIEDLPGALRRYLREV
mgnify:CR=1 FL=1